MIVLFVILSVLFNSGNSWSCSIGSLKTVRQNTFVMSTVEPKSPLYIRNGLVQNTKLAAILVTSFAGFSKIALAADPYGYDQPPNRYTDMATVSTGIKPDYSAIRKDIETIIESSPAKGPTLVRLAWHSSGTYDKISKTGGSEGGTIRFKEELAHESNGGLDVAVSWLEPVYKKFNKVADFSYADLYTLAGVVAIAKMGGPKIPWRAGRIDEFDPSKVTPNGRIPDADKGSPKDTAAHLRTIFNRMGFNDQEIVVLSGAHALGRCHVTSSGYVGPWTFTPTTFNNAYFQLLVSEPYTPNLKANKFQYKDRSGFFMMLPSDIVLIQDDKFKPYVELYAKNKKKFFDDFSIAFQKLEELGTHDLFEVKI
eukprot:gene15154-20414_t